MALALRFAMGKLALAVIAVLFASSAAPALAQGGGDVPEPSTTLLLALGVLGVIVGRRGAMRPKRRLSDPDEDRE